jgi:hypothetical protein
VVALELDIVHDTVRRVTSRRIPADGFASQTDMKFVYLGFFLASHTRFKGQSFAEFRDFYSEFLCIVPTHYLFA